MSEDHVPFLAFEQQLRGLKGMALGLRLPTALTRIRYSGPPPEDLSGLDDVLADFVGESAAPVHVSTADPTRALVERLCHWQSALQRQVRIPVAETFKLRELVSDVTQKKQIQRYQLALAYVDLQATTLTLHWLLKVINQWLRSTLDAQKLECTIQQAYEELQSFLRQRRVGGTNLIHFLDAAHVLQIPLTQLVADVYCFGHGKNSKLLMSSLTDTTGAVGVGVAKDKFKCAEVLRKFGIPVARHALARDEKRAVEIARELGYPVVVKPADHDQGRGVFAGLKTENAVLSAFRETRQISSRILVEKHHGGEDYRLTVMHDRVIKIVHRRPGGVLGNGYSSVGDLVKQLQETESSRRVLKRGGKHRLSLDSEAFDLLVEQGMTPECIVPDGKFVTLRRKANISAGGEYVVIPTSDVHPDNLALAIRAAQVLRLDIAGIDLIIPDVAATWRDSEAIICEVNAQPQIGFRDTPAIFQNILTELLPERGVIPVHLWIPEHAIDEPALSHLLLRSTKQGLQALAANGRGWINAVRTAGTYQDTFSAARALLCDNRVHSAVVVMTADDILRFGLPAPHFDSIRVLTDGSPNSMPSTLRPLLAMLVDYSEKIEIMAAAETVVHRYAVRTTTAQDVAQ